MFAHSYLVISGICSAFLVFVSGAGSHYKPCTRLKNTVNFNKPICTDNGFGNFDDASAKNCHELRAACPEFSSAGCVRISNISWTNNTAASDISLPCCRLALENTSVQMEVFYTLQYGVDTEVYDIVEVRRNVQDNVTFAGRAQKDWPDSVADPKGERGLKWTTISQAVPPSNLSGNPSDLCVNATDGRCNVNLVLWLAMNYPKGFNESLIPTMTAEENRTKADARYTIDADEATCCRDILVGGAKTRACQVFYSYNSKYSRQVAGRSVPVDVWFNFLEVLVYWSALDNGLSLKYAYWSREDLAVRAEIFDRA